MDEIEAEFEIEDIRLRRRAGWRCVRTSGALSLQLHRPCGPGPISSHKLTSASCCVNFTLFVQSL